MKPQTCLSVSIDDQKLSLIVNGACVREFVVSTARNGIGTAIGSFRTPTGKFRISEKIGAGEPIGTIFRGRKPVGLWDPSQATEDDLILTRILRLDGLDDDNSNTLERCIYIHGTNREDLLGVASSHGCIRMGNEEIRELFEQVDVGDGLQILPAANRSGGADAFG
jgi:lipoprotein-anchoring transpeptidase ErfK/SrfK